MEMTSAGKDGAGDLAVDLSIKRELTLNERENTHVASQYDVFRRRSMLLPEAASGADDRSRSYSAAAGPGLEPGRRTVQSRVGMQQRGGDRISKSRLGL